MKKYECPCGCIHDPAIPTAELLPVRPSRTSRIPGSARSADLARMRSPRWIDRRMRHTQSGSAVRPSGAWRSRFGILTQGISHPRPKGIAGREIP